MPGGPNFQITGTCIRAKQAHRIAHHAEAKLLADVPRVTGATIHTSPTGAHHATV